VIDAAFLDDFRRTIDRAAEQLLACSDTEASRQPAPGKWSRKEIIGHLIDSASNNHGRFVRAQLQDDLVFTGYDQDAWVRLQRYQECGWVDLVQLWRAYNHQIANIMEAADADALERPMRTRSSGRACATIYMSLPGRRCRRPSPPRSRTSCATTSDI
jgi:hypothetical protein